MTTNEFGVIISGQTFGVAVTPMQVVYLHTDGKWYPARANAEATSAGDIAIALDTAAANGTGRVLQLGYVANSAWALTPGRAVYISPTTAGALTQTKPSTGNVVRAIGYATSATVIHIDPTPASAPVATVEGLEVEHGAVIYGTASAWTKLSPGQFGQVLTTNGPGAAPAWRYPYSCPAEVIGIEWDTLSSSPTLTRIDAAGKEITDIALGFFDSHPTFGGRWRCVRDRATGQITFGANARGDGLILDGSAGDVLVREPAFYVKHEYDDDTGLARWWISPTYREGFSLHPYFYMRGGGVPAPYMFSGAYEAYGLVYGGQFRLGSASGKQPVTGSVGYPDLPNNGRLTIDDAELYASRISPGNAGITSFWGYCADQLLMYIEYGTFDIQTALGKGIVDLPFGAGFAGKLTGADNIDSRLAENGTGTGDGVDGQTPICWRGIENPYGNVWKFIIGCNFKAGGIFRTINRDGSGTLAGTMADGSYEEGSGVPQVNGYVSGLLEDELGGLAIMPSAAGGSDSTYLCDYWYAPTGDRILLAGGSWYLGRSAGPGYRAAYYAVSSSFRNVGARVEFRPSQGV